MEKIWTKYYQEGVSATIEGDAFSSLPELLEHCFDKYSSNVAFEHRGTRLTYTEIDKYSQHVANYLLHVLKLKKGDRVAVMLPNLLQYPVALFGILRAGLIAVSVNPLYTADELVHQLDDSGTKAIIILDLFAATLEKALPNIFRLKHIIITSVGDFYPFPKRVLVNWIIKSLKSLVPEYFIPNCLSFLSTLKQGQRFAFKPAKIAAEDIAFLQYTGGTMGPAKGAMLTHRNVLANIEQARCWVATTAVEGQEKIITVLPMYHILALTANCLAFLTLGGSNLLIANPRDTRGIIKEIKDSKFSCIIGVNTIFNALLNEEELKTVDFSHLKYSFSGGMALQADVSKRWKAVSKRPILEGYGLTETSPLVTMNPFYLEDYNGNVGLPMPSTDIKIIDDFGKELPIGEVGELCVKGPQVMKGYWEQDEETAKAFTDDGWFMTGDIARVDEKGFVYLIDRKKDIIIVSGFNVYPNEIENVIAGHPGVIEVGVVGAIDNETGERVRACVVRNDKSLKQEDLIEYCREYLTAYKVPKEIIFFEELPKTNVGKILRRVLRG